MPFTTEYYINKAKKLGYSMAEIKAVLVLPQLWNKVLSEKKKFSDTLFFYLELGREGRLPSQKIPQNYKSNQINRLY